MAHTIIQVPFAKDGSFFHPRLQKARTGTYTVGGKDHEVQIASFERALALLAAMRVARWRRPNSQGNWGIVAAVRWGDLPDRH